MMNKMMMLLFYSFVLGFLVSCGHTTSIDGKPIKGCITEKRYYDSYGWFSVECSPQEQIQEFQDELVSCVIFHFFGGMEQYEVSLIPDEYLSENNNAQIIKDNEECVLQYIVLESMYKCIKKPFPDTKLSHEEFVDFEDGHKGYFLIFEIPGAGTLVNLETGKRVDSNRALLAFFCNNQLVIMSTQLSPLATNIPIEWRLRRLLEMKLGYRNETIQMQKGILCELQETQ